MDASAAGDKIHGYLLNLWSGLLGRSDLGPLEDFFHAGGSSMQAIEMLWTVSAMYVKDIDHTMFFKNPCISNLVELIEAAGPLGTSAESLEAG